MIDPATPSADLKVLGGHALILTVGRSLVTLDNQPGKTKVTVDYAGQLRLFAGQPDPNDNTRFEIPYELDGVRGVITGILIPDDHLKLTPDRYLSNLEADPHTSAVVSPNVRRAKGLPRRVLSRTSECQDI